MNARLGSGLAIAGAATYLLVWMWAISATTYDVWGVLVVIPPLGLIAVLVVRAMFSGQLLDLRRILYAGLALKLLGTAVRYWVGFDAYQGSIDAQRYHDYAVGAATDVWAGRANLLSIFPGGTGTRFMEGVTAFIYTFTGTSKMAGFVIFSLLGFVGMAFFVKAACIAVPGLARSKYATLCVLAPSLVYWPSSIGKDASLLFLLGLATYGIARLVSREAVVMSTIITTLGFIGAAYIRPHIVGIWLAGLLPALFVAVLRGRDPWGSRPSKPLERALLVPVVVFAAIGLIFVSLVTVKYLDPGVTGGDQSVSSSITSILDETSRRTEQAGSAFQPPSISNPLNWPYASIRTLTRPLPTEVRGAAQLLTALETAIFLVLCAVSWRRLLNVPKMFSTYPYMAFAMTTMLLSGLAFTSFANLAVLARQRSIVVPLMLLVVCIPPRRGRAERRTEEWRTPVPSQSVAQNNSMSPSVRAQLDNGGSPGSFTARQVSTGPPPGSGRTNGDDNRG